MSDDGNRASQNRGKPPGRPRGRPFVKGQKDLPGRRFQPGNRQNPGGRPRALLEVKRRIQVRGLELVAELFRIVDAPGVRARDRIHAITVLLAYGYGRPVLAVEVSGPGGGPVEHREIDNLTSGERAKRLVELLVKAGARVIREAEPTLLEPGTRVGNLTS